MVYVRSMMSRPFSSYSSDDNLPIYLKTSLFQLISSGTHMTKQVMKIQRRCGYTADAYTFYPVLIIGAGESGIATGCRLKEALGFDQFRIFDRQSGIGGTWWINRYPGVACDMYAIITMLLFSVSVWLLC